jgi:acetyl-CoA synthetase
MSKYFPALADWQWQLPEQLNIGVACTDLAVEKGLGDRTAMIVEDDTLGESRYSYSELSDASSRFASVLMEQGVTEADRVLIRLPNALSYPTAFFGTMKMGGIAVPTSTLLSASEVAYLAKDSMAKVLVTAKSMWQELKDVVLADPTIELVLLAGSDAMPEDAKNISTKKIRDFDQALKSAEPLQTMAATRPDDAAYLVYTSGTTGYPKGVLHGHRSLYGRLPASEFWFQFQEDNNEGTERIMHSGKFNWTYVLGSALMDPLFHGKTVIVHEGQNDAELWPRLIKKHNCTIFIGVPTIYRQIIQKTNISKKDVPSLRHCMSAGEHLSDEMLGAWRERFAMDVYEAIGMSELSYYISQSKYKPIRPGSAGFPQPGHEVTLLDADMNEVGIDEEGMICIPDSDPGLFLQYWQLEEQTQEAKHDGWFFTGDYARRDKDGYIWFLGRRDDIINTFGYRVSPHEIERVMNTHAAIANCVAVEEEIAQDKTIISLCVILFDEHKGKVDEAELLAFAAANLAKYKTPKKIYFLDEFPRTKNGKVIRKQLTQSIAAKNPREG